MVIFITKQIKKTNQLQVEMLQLLHRLFAQPFVIWFVGKHVKNKRHGNQEVPFKGKY